jgi:hypothetical protein
MILALSVPLKKLGAVVPLAKPENTHYGTIVVGPVHVQEV